MALPAVACIVTEYRPRSHADVIVSKLIGGHTFPAPYEPEKFDFHRAARQFAELPLPLDASGRLCQPRVRVASLYTDQVPVTDISREWAERAGIQISPTIRHALTLGGDRLAVDGVVLIGEHGDYPENERGQQLYPRRRFFEETVAVFKESGRSVPVFNDKHLGYAWHDAKWMVDTAREMGFAFMAGSSLSTQPLTWRKPPLDLPVGTYVETAVVAGYGPLERYGIHMLEVLQSMVERRRGGETGVAAVQCLSGEAVWEAEARGTLGPAQWDAALVDAALATVPDRRAGDPRALAREPHVFLVDYRDGLRAAVFLLNGVLTETAFAARAALPGQDAPHTVSTWFSHYSQEPFGHFAHLAELIQDMILTGVSPVPIERTLLTTGILDRVMESHWRGGVRLETPELAVRYAPREAHPVKMSRS